MQGSFVQSVARRMVPVLVAASAIIGASGVALAKEHGKLKASLSKDEPGTLVLQWTGKVAAPMASQIERAFESRKDQVTRVVLALDSGGGNIKEGERTIKVLRQIRTTHQLETVVNHGKRCGSMCVFIYMQGKKRVAALTSSWLFHEASKKEDDRVVSLDRGKWERLMDKYFVPEGVSPEWIAAMKPLTHRTDLWQTGADLVNGGSGIIHEALGNQKGRIVHDGKPAGPAVERIPTSAQQ